MDRNLSMGLDGRFKLWSLSARRAWIEIRLVDMSAAWNRVALRKESVDRNNGVHYDNYNLHCRSPQGERG